MLATPPEVAADSMNMTWWSARHPPDDPQTSFTGKTVLITGANVGLGFETFLKVAKLGADRIILGMRSLERGEKAKAQVVQQTGYASGHVSIYHLDQSTFESVRKFAAEVAKNEPRVDVAILNAGAGGPDWKLSAHGYEMSTQINALSTALVAILLMPQLRTSSKLSTRPSHLEFVGSTGHHSVKSQHLDFPPNAKILDKVSEKAYFEPRNQYCMNKLLVMYIMQGLVEAEAQRQADGEVIITTCCPNLCRTNLGREFGNLLKIQTYLFHQVFARSAEQGARTIVSGVTLGKEANNQFWSHDVLFR